MNNLDAIYEDVDDFYLLFEPKWQAHIIEVGEKQRIKSSRLTSSDVMSFSSSFIIQVFEILKLITRDL